MFDFDHPERIRKLQECLSLRLGRPAQVTTLFQKSFQTYYPCGLCGKPISNHYEATVLVNRIDQVVEHYRFCYNLDTCMTQYYARQIRQALE